MKYISTDDSEKFDIKNGALTESHLRGSTARYFCNPIVDDITAVDPDERADPIHPKIEYVPPSCLVTGEPSINDLASWRWQGRTVDAETERELIRRIQEGDPRCRAGEPQGCACRSCRAFFDPRPNAISLLPAFHHSIRKITNGYVPSGSQKRKYKKTSAPDGRQRSNLSGKITHEETAPLIFQDLMAVGCFGLWKSALAFDFDRGFRLWTIAQPKIDGLISNEANYLRQKGYTSGDTVGRYLWKKVGQRTQSRLDRWIFDHLGSPPEELLEAQAKLGLKRQVFHSFEEAASAIKAANSLEHSDVDSDDGEDGSGDVPDTAATEPSEEFRDLYDSYKQLNWSPQLAPHLNKVSPIVDFWIQQLCDPPRIKAKPQPKPVYKPCAVKPTGRVLHPIDKPYWMEPHDKYPTYRALKPYDPDRRRVAVIRLNSGETRRLYCQTATGRGRHIKVTAKLNAQYCAMIEANEPKRKRNVRPNRNQTTGSATAEIIVFQSRASGVAGLHVGERYNPPCIGERFAGTRIAGER